VLSVFVRAFRTPDLRKKLLFTGAMIVCFRFGANLPAPGISEQNVSYCSRMSNAGGVGHRGDHVDGRAHSGVTLVIERPAPVLAAA